VHEKRIEIRWRDMDAFGHVNNAVYLTYLEEVRDEWLERALGSEAPISDFVLARVAIDFRRELRQEDDEILLRCELDRVGTSSVRTRERVLFRDGTVAAEAEAVLVARSVVGGDSRSRPLSDGERAALEKEAARS
jgi:acyl-CoA thioester hydrolase